MKFTKLLTEVEKLGYKRQNEYHAYKMDETICMADVDDIEYHNIEMLFIKDWLRNNKQLDIEIRTDIDQTDEGYNYVVYSAYIHIIPKNKRNKHYQVYMEQSDYILCTYFECLQYAISEAINYIDGKR